MYVLWEFYSEQIEQSVKRNFGWGIWNSLSKGKSFETGSGGNTSIVSSVPKSEQAVDATAGNEDVRTHFNHYTCTRYSPVHKCKEGEQRRILKVKLIEFSATACPKEDSKSGRTDVLWYQDNGKKHNTRHVERGCSTEVAGVKPSQIWWLLVVLVLCWGMRKTCVRPTKQPLKQLPQLTQPDNEPGIEQENTDYTTSVPPQQSRTAKKQGNKNIVDTRGFGEPTPSKHSHNNKAHTNPEHSHETGTKKDQQGTRNNGTIYQVLNTPRIVDCVTHVPEKHRGTTEPGTISKSCANVYSQSTSSEKKKKLENSQTLDNTVNTNTRSLLKCDSNTSAGQKTNKHTSRYFSTKVNKTKPTHHENTSRYYPCRQHTTNIGTNRDRLPKTLQPRLLPKSHYQQQSTYKAYKKTDWQSSQLPQGITEGQTRALGNETVIKTHMHYQANWRTNCTSQPNKVVGHRPTQNTYSNEIQNNHTRTNTRRPKRRCSPKNAQCAQYRHQATANSAGGGTPNRAGTD